MSGFETVAYLAFASAAISAVAAVDQADTQRKVMHTKADQDRANAVEVSRQATEQIEGQRAKARSVIGVQLASTSESGTGLNGSNLDLLNQSLVNNEMDSLSIRYQGDRNTKALNAQAGMDDMAADSATTGGYLSAAGSLLNGAAKGGSYTSGNTQVPWSGYGGRH